MTEFTIKRLLEIAEDGFLAHGESKALARALLSILLLPAPEQSRGTAAVEPGAQVTDGSNLYAFLLQPGLRLGKVIALQVKRESLARREQHNVASEAMTPKERTQHDTAVALGSLLRPKRRTGMNSQTEERDQFAADNNMSIEFVDWFFDKHKDGCGNMWFVLAAAMWEGWKGREQLGAVPVAYADPQAFRNFANGTATKEWMWKKRAPGLRPLYDTPPAAPESAPPGLTAAVNNLLNNDGSRGRYSAIECSNAREKIEQLLRDSEVPADRR